MSKSFRGIICLGLLMACVPGIVASAHNAGITREPFQIALGGFHAQGEMTYPAAGDGPFPTIILVHGSGPADMNNTISTVDLTTGQLKDSSANFADIADFLSERGFTVIRYNKRFVNGPNDADYMRYSMEVDLPTLAEDLITVLDFALLHPYVANDAIYFYGWSEGSTVAAHVAVDNEKVAGLILQTPVALPWRETFETQIYDVGVPFLQSTVGDGFVTDEVLLQVYSGNEGGMVAKSIANYVVDGEAAQVGLIKINPLLDLDGDGKLSIEDEIIPGLEFILDFAFSEMGYFSIYSPDRALPILLDQVDSLRLPTLILQGEHDANTPAYGARRLADALDAAGVDVTLKMYSGLGHSLGPAESTIMDEFAPIAQEPLHDLLEWLQAMI